jgi:RNA methyltransferase, TrmH family
MTITGQHNRKLKEIRKLRMRRRWRERSGRFVAEGEDLLAAADEAGWKPVQRYVVTGSGLEGTEVDASLLASASGIASGTRALAVYREKWAEKPIGPLCVYLHGIHDPGNLGAIVRSADAFAASSLALGPETADPFGPKAVRASMGAIFTVPIARAAALADLPGLRIALVPGEGTPISELWRSSFTPPNQNAKVRPEITLMIGSEREGLPQTVIQDADLTAHIPIKTNSLNAAMAATVALYELAHTMQRR